MAGWNKYVCKAGKTLLKCKALKVKPFWKSFCIFAIQGTIA